MEILVSRRLGLELELGLGLEPLPALPPLLVVRRTDTIERA